MVKVTMLLENTNFNNPELSSKHGLCLYINMPKHKILFDVGPDDTFIKNASKLGIDLSKVDTVIISHGHKDHAGGLKAFLKINSKAKIYIQKNAFNPHFAKVFGINFNVGIDKSIKDSNRVILTDYYYIIDETIQVFSEIPTSKLLPSSNNSLYTKRNGKIKKDSFSHEQNLLVTLGETNILFSGCSHRGILNILEKAQDIAHTNINYVFGGMHIFNPINKKLESDRFIGNLAISLFNSKTMNFYTCHCTSKNGFEKMKKIMDGKLDYISTGDTIKIKIIKNNNP